MSRMLKFFLVMICLFSAVEVFAAPILSVRLVEASHAGQGMGAGLGDVAHLLQNNLPYKSFHLLASRSMSLPASGVASLSAGMVAKCTGGLENLNVVIEQGGKKVLQTTLGLREGTPLIIGGIPSRQGKLIVIFLAK